MSTGIWLSERLVGEFCDGGALLPRGRIVTPAGFDLAHRRLVAACRAGTDGFEAHLTRVVHRHLGIALTTVRGLLAGQ